MSNTQKKNVPELRFPGFEGEWEEKQFADFTKINQGLQIAINERKTEYSPEWYFYITNEFLRPNSQTKYFIENPPQSVIANKEDILMTRTGNTGKVVTNVFGAFHNNFFKIKFDKNLYDRLFLVEVLNSSKIQNKILSLAGSSTIPDLNHSDFYSISSSYPLLREQQKIGKFFSKLDRQIELEEQKLELLKQQKKGYMQKIFSQELRFKDENGNDYPEWESKSIQEIFENKGGTALETEFNFDGNYKVISIGSYSINSTYNDQNIRVNKNKKTEKYILSKGDLAMVLNDKTKDGKIIGRSIFIDKDNQYIYNQRTERLIPFAENDNKFLWFLMNTDLIRNKIKGMMQGATQVYINYSSIKLISIQLPLLEEQQKIRGFLEVLSGITTEQLHKIDQLKERKKAFLQKMFI
ncbi:restriction endonuclease subunit S [Staphylococcus aureus]|uniref:restriction endonuclease subunit S n=1 Tax=Staphylococcus aureus TaxID=1280 RepID=UPI000A95FB45|nr:restriction endonuclease subunit S [Staphylococcus aureus]MDN4123173.1 restriction endonuclease subunit S [Staphylococcus aureus]MVW53913.1 restriction endonuclease subunit S [Staphylococcus aureus]NSL46292.1 restriction endonuclease subunit S [Staphylococcus aureus]PCF69078.1 type I restriction endonuclease subunit S [Staphylococcus aureus]